MIKVSKNSNYGCTWPFKGCRTNNLHSARYVKKFFHFRPFFHFPYFCSFSPILLSSLSYSSFVPILS